MQVVSKEEIARRLRQGREESGLRQGDVAEKLGVTQGLVSQWEKGNVPEGACEVTAFGLLVGVRPDELYLSDISSSVRTIPADTKLAPVEQDALGIVVDCLLRMRKRGIPISDTATFLTSVLREPASGTSESAPRPPHGDRVKQAQRLLDSVLADLPAESVLFEELDTFATRLEKIAATLPSSDPRGQRADRVATAPKVSQGAASQPSGHKKKNRS